jgi:predicted phosphoribosyltransferase
MAKLRIVSRSNEPFRSREETGRLLGKELLGLPLHNVVILGIPRGGLVVAREIAHVLNAPLDLVLSRKLRTPDQPELALGSVSENGRVFLNESIVRQLGVSNDYIRQETRYQLEEIEHRSRLIRGIHPRVSLKDRAAVITDDGIATGATIEAAIWAIRQEEPAKIVLAVPVASENSLLRLAQSVNEVVCLRAPPFFAAIGQFYIYFEQVNDEEMLQILRQEQAGLRTGLDKTSTG